MHNAISNHSLRLWPINCSIEKNNRIKNSKRKQYTLWIAVKRRPIHGLQDTLQVCATCRWMLCLTIIWCVLLLVIDSWALGWSCLLKFSFDLSKKFNASNYSSSFNQAISILIFNLESAWQTFLNKLADFLNEKLVQRKIWFETKWINSNNDRKLTNLITKSNTEQFTKYK